MQITATEFLVTVIVSIACVLIYYLFGPKQQLQHVGPALNPRDYRKFKLVERSNVNHNTRSFRFALQTSSTVLGLPIGQHMMFRCKRGSETVEREYTPISSDLDVGYFDLMIKIYEKGAMTQHLEHLEVGDYLEVRGPRGPIIYDSIGRFKFPFSKQKFHDVTHIGMIAGGTGITPMLQILRQIERESNDHTKCSLIFGNVSENDILLFDEMKEVRDKNDNIDIYFVVDKIEEGSKWNGGVGYITPKMIQEQLPSPNDETVILLCGPTIMVDIMKKHLSSLDYSADSVKCF